MACATGSLCARPGELRLGGASAGGGLQPEDAGELLALATFLSCALPPQPTAQCVMPANVHGSNRAINLWLVACARTAQRLHLAAPPPRTRWRRRRWTTATAPQQNNPSPHTKKTNKLDGAEGLLALAPAECHVLLVDDEPLSRLVVGNLLRKCSYQVTVAESGTAALDMLRRSVPGTFQLILTVSVFFVLVCVGLMCAARAPLDINQQRRSKHPLKNIPTQRTKTNPRTFRT